MWTIFSSHYFSIMYHKEFIAMDGNKDARMKGFLKLCGLSERGIDLKNHK